ncbi:hypothetical protein [Streptomyces sp. WMMB 322]|uniref:hypothetical protein n=1 Tax=Streptomyces sp. WMMB 322 TaxID=1286821 RepID=UPI0006E43561|nr:hypothetical protein [Streptomyces sp. WMMB 322]SCK05794.1 hypothetical protein H180DRAFT_00111 [Streptomyces sp. WMMB 322]
MTAWPPIDRDDLRRARGDAGFDTVLPLLIRRLIAETASGLESLDMPGGSGTAVGGFDGIATASGPSTFVPEGTSVWELSVGGGNSKAEEDYEKRTEGPNGLATKDVTYVEVILDTWRDARTWAARRTEDGRWREVRGYNLDKIDLWLEQAPATTAWLAARLGKALPGVRSLGTWWTDSWLRSTRVPLDRTVVLAGREKAAADFSAVLATKRSVIALGSDLRPDELCAFVAAALEQEGILGPSQVGTRVLFVSNRDSLEQLVEQPQSLILVLADPALARDIPQQHPHQLVWAAMPGGPCDVTVPRLHSQAIESMLQSAGMSHERAARFGKLGRRSLLALRRALAHHPESLTPERASTPDVVRRRLLLLNSWHGDNREDRRVVGQCLGLEYEKVQERARELAAGTDIPFLGELQESWHVLAAEDAWTLFGTSLTSDDLHVFRRAVLEVLTETDPVLDLDPSERWRAGVMGVRRRFSDTLRAGLAQSLALLGTLGADLRGPQGVAGDRWARLVVRDLLKQANADDTYSLWRSLGDVLTLVAEAAPEEFIEAMNEGLSGTTPLHAAMFTDDQPDSIGLGASSPHTMFLWSLEILAWSPEHLDDAVNVLTGLSVVDPGGRLSNRPLASLVGILSAWAPNTSAPVEDRISVIQRLARKHPVVGRKLLVQLIPDSHAMQMVHPGPRFRDWKRETAVTPDDRRSVTNVVVDLLLDELNAAPELYVDLIGKIDDLPPLHRNEVAQRLTELADGLEDDNQRAVLHHALRDQISRHQEYSDTAWALPDDELRPLQAAYEALEPRDPVQKHAWLFQSHLITLGDIRRRDNFAAYDAEILTRRAAAIGEVVASGGLRAVAALASATEFPLLVGIALAEHSVDHDQELLSWLEEDASPAKEVATGYLRRRMWAAQGNDLRDRLLSLTEVPQTQAVILQLAPEPAIAWSKLPELSPEVSEHYWRAFSYFGLGSDFPRALDAARSLLSAGRPAAALDLILMYDREGDSAEAAEVVVTGLEDLIAARLSDPEIGRLSSGFQNLFALLARHHEHVGRERILNLEWQLFPALGFEAEAPILHKTLVEDPGAFVDLVTRSFRPSTNAEEDVEDPVEQENRRNIASRAYDVLRALRTCPGLTADGNLDPVALRTWVMAARAELASRDRARIGDQQIGQVLAFAPCDPDDLQVPEAVRDLLEEINSGDLERGLSIGIYNKRGVTSRGLLDGGVQESELARSFREQAERAREWPRTRKVFKELAESYEADARREDQEAERRHQGLE